MSSTMSKLMSTSTMPLLLYPNFSSLSLNPTSQASFLKKNDLASSYIRINLRYDPLLMISQRSFVVRSNITPPPGVPLPSGSPSGSMRNWIVGIVLTFVLPFCTHKWGPLLLLKNKVDNVVNTAEYIMETIESVAEKVDNVIDHITDDLPENSEIRKNMEAFDAVVEGVAKSAHVANTIIDKVEEVEDKLASLIVNESKEEVVSGQVVEMIVNKSKEEAVPELGVEMIENKSKKEAVSEQVVLEMTVNKSRDDGVSEQMVENSK